MIPRRRLGQQGLEVRDRPRLHGDEPEMSTWTTDELKKIGAAEELEVSSAIQLRRESGSCVMPPVVAGWSSRRLPRMVVSLSLRRVE